MRGITAVADHGGITLPQGWKVEVAKQAKARLIGRKDPLKGREETLERWRELFARIDAAGRA